MADDKRKAPGGAARRKPPTIDLTATEVSIPADDAPVETSAPETHAEVRPAAPSEDRASDAPLFADQNKMSETPTREFLSEASRTAPAATSPWWHFAVAGAAGGIAMIAVTVSLWFAGIVPIRFAAPTATRARVAALELQVHELANRPVAAIDSKASDDIAARLEKIEKSLAALPAADAADKDRLATLDGSVKALGVAVAGLGRRLDDVAGHAAAARDQANAATAAIGDLRAAAGQAPAPAAQAELEALQRRIAALESNTNSASAAAAASESLGATMRFALAATALRDTVERGRPFVAELAAVKSASDVSAPMTSQIAALEPFATAGVPADSALAQQLLALVPALTQAVRGDAPAAAGFVERLQANAEKLIRVRPVGAPAGDDPAAVVARIEAFASSGDLMKARAELAKLPAAARGIVAAWENSVAARDAARAAALALATGASRALAKP